MDKNTLIRIAIWAGPILGSLIGILGGAFGTYCSIKNTKGPRERAFMVRASLVCWVGVAIFVLGMLFAPAPYKYGLIGIYVMVLLLAVRYWNRRQAVIRAEESNRAA
jgi:Ca2+/Na+ antiporter